MARPVDALLGRLAVERGLLTRAQLDAALRVQEAERPVPPIGVVLVEHRFLTHEQVDEPKKSTARSGSRPGARMRANLGGLGRATRRAGRHDERHADRGAPAPGGTA